MLKRLSFEIFGKKECLRVLNLFLLSKLGLKHSCILIFKIEKMTYFGKEMGL